jgi:hypothetical protein
VAVIGFKERITDLAGSLGAADDNALQQWIIDGCYDVISKVKGSGEVEASEFAKQSSAYTSSMTVALDDVRDVISVERDGISCQKIPFSKAKYADPNTTLGAMSIHKATSLSPVFYKHDNQLIVKPNPTVVEQGYYSYIPEYSITDWTVSTASIDSFPNQYYEHVILYAAIATLDRQLLDLLTNTNIDTAITAVKTQLTDAQNKFTSFSARTFGDEDTFITDKSQVAQVLDALSNAKSLFDAGGTTDYLGQELTNNVVEWLNDEDSEMANSVLNAAQAEMQRAQSELSHWQAIGRTGIDEVSSSLSIAQALMSDIQSRMERDKQQYQWQQERRDNLKREYLSKFPQAGNKGGQ